MKDRWLLWGRDGNCGRRGQGYLSIVCTPWSRRVFNSTPRAGLGFLRDSNSQQLCQCRSISVLPSLATMSEGNNQPPTLYPRRPTPTTTLSVLWPSPHVAKWSVFSPSSLAPYQIRSKWIHWKWLYSSCSRPVGSAEIDQKRRRAALACRPSKFNRVICDFWLKMWAENDANLFGVTAVKRSTRFQPLSLKVIEGNKNPE